MPFPCPQCHVAIKVDASLIPPAGMQCPSCGTLVTSSSAVPLPGMGAVPLPGVGAVPLPGVGAVPLPGGGAVPLPGMGAVPLPGGGAVPLPGVGAVPLPGGMLTPGGAGGFSAPAGSPLAAPGQSLSMEDIFGPSPAPPTPPPAPSWPGSSPPAAALGDIFDGPAPAPPPLPAPPRPAPDEAPAQHLFHGQATGVLDPDQAAREAIARADDPAYQVRKRSGRVIGPFPTSKILEMFKRGELLGSEDASTDGVTWRSMGQIPAFAAAIQEAMASAMAGLEDLPIVKKSDAGAGGAAGEGGEGGGSGVDTMALLEAERLKLGVERKRSMRSQLGPRLVIAGALGTVVIAAGIATNFVTDYGYFGLKLVFPDDAIVEKKEDVGENLPAQQAAGPAEAAPVLIARDTFAAYRQGAEQAERIVASAKDLNPVPDSARKAAALYAQFLAYLVVVEETSSYQPKLSEALAMAAGDELAKAVGEAALAYSQKDWDKGIGLVKPLTDPARPLDPILRSEVWTWVGIGERGKADLNAASSSFDNALQANMRNKLALYLQALNLRDTKVVDGAQEYLSKVIDLDPAHPRASALLGRLLVTNPANRDKGLKLLVEASEGKASEVAAPHQRASAFIGRATLALAEHDYPLALRMSGQAVELTPLDRDVRMTAADIGLRLRDYAAAKANGKKVLELNPDDIEATIAVARADIGNREPLSAYTALQAASKKKSDDAVLYYWFGVAARELSKLDEARKHFDKSAKLDPTRAGPVVELLYDAIDQGKLTDAVKRAADSESKVDAGDRHKIRAAKALAYTRRRAFADAEKEYKKALEENPSDADARAYYVSMLSAQKRVAEGQEQLKEAQTQDSKNPMVVIAHGDVLAASGDLKGALDRYQEAMQIAPNAHQSYVRAARVCAEMRDFGRAKGFVDTAGQLRPGIAEVIAAQAVVVRATDAANAAQLLQQASELAPEEPFYPHELGITFANMAAPLEAVDALKKAVGLDPTYADAYFQLGKVYRDLGRQRDAKDAIERCLKYEPKRVDAWLELADLASTQGDDEGTLKAYERALQANPDNAATTCAMGETLVLRMGGEPRHLKRGVDTLEKCVRLMPTHATAWVTLGNGFKTVGKRKEALRAFKQHLQNVPGDSPETAIARDQIADLEDR